jgi:hypothetical protein
VFLDVAARVNGGIVEFAGELDVEHHAPCGDDLSRALVETVVLETAAGEEEGFAVRVRMGALEEIFPRPDRLTAVNPGLEMSGDAGEEDRRPRTESLLSHEKTGKGRSNSRR